MGGIGVILALSPVRMTRFIGLKDLVDNKRKPTTAKSFLRCCEALNTGSENLDTMEAGHRLICRHSVND